MQQKLESVTTNANLYTIHVSSVNEANNGVCGGDDTDDECNSDGGGESGGGDKGKVHARQRSGQRKHANEQRETQASCSDHNRIINQRTDTKIEASRNQWRDLPCNERTGA